MLPTAEEAEYLQYVPIEGWPSESELIDTTSAHRATVKLEPTIKSGYSGTIWGVDGSYAGQWLSTLELPSELSRDLRYDRSTRVLGRTGDFAWHGFCRSVIEIRRLNDETNLGFWSELKLLDTIFILTTRPDEGFRELSLHGVEGAIEQVDGTFIDGAHYTQRTARTDDGRFVYRLWTVVSESRPNRWIYAVTDREDHRTYMWDVFVVGCDVPRLIPVERGDIFRAHHDVENIDGVAVRDMTEFGAWSRQNLYIEAPTELPKQSQLTIYGAMITGLICMTCIVMFRRACLRERSML